ncbi:MAG: hypothetical protein ACI3XZ_07950, partial [Butyricicoccus sp.]
MKKAISILLVCLLVCSLFVGCSKDDGQPDQTAGSGASQPAGDGQQEGGEISFVAGILPSTDIEILVTMMDYVKAQCEAKGIEFQLSGAMFENTKYIELIENYVTMGADVII